MRTLTVIGIFATMVFVAYRMNREDKNVQSTT